MKKLFWVLVILPFLVVAQQRKKIKIVEEPLTNRVAFYAVNENHQDFDVLFTLKGTNFRQSKARPRWIRVPAASKVHLKTVVLERGKKASFIPALKVNDSLSKRSLKRPTEKLDIPPPKIEPKRKIVVYLTNDCDTCAVLVDSLNANNYAFRSLNLDENTDLKAKIGRYSGKSEAEMEALKTPILSLGGHLFTWIDSYDKLLEELNK